MSTAVGNAPAQFAPTASQLDMAYSVCRSIARAAAKNFYYGFAVLPRRKRNALSAVYAFMRRCDDIADNNTLSPADRHHELLEWLNKVHRALASQPTDDPVLLALTDAQRTYQIPVGLLDQLAYGTAADLEDGGADSTGAGPLVARYQTFEELRQYCYGVASVVGLVCIKIFGYRDPAAEPLAERCGLAFQLTNIIRDVKEDVAVGRVYFPQEDLAQCGLAAADLAGPQIDVARIRPLLALEGDRALECYREAEKLIPMVSEDSQPALWVLITIYRRLLEKIALKQYDVFTERVRLTVPEKVAILGEHGLVLTDAQIAQMLRQGTWLCPTLSVYYTDWAPENTPAGRRDRKRASEHEVSFRKALKAGVKIAFGTDMGGIPWTQPIAQEFPRMIELGMTPMQAIQSATARAAELLDMKGRLGAIVPGAYADIVAVAGDPLTNIKILESVGFVMKDGKIFKNELASKNEAAPGR